MLRKCLHSKGIRTPSFCRCKRTSVNIEKARPSFWILLFISSFSISTQTLAADKTNPTIEDFCKIYEDGIGASNFSTDEDRELAKSIVEECKYYTEAHFLDKKEPAKNFRAVTPQKPEQENSCSLYRMGQPAPQNSSPEVLKNFRKNMLGFDFVSAHDSFRIDDVIDLRFDPHYKWNEQQLFGADFPTLPISSGEAIYSFEVEKTFVESSGMNSIYAPTPPELEHFFQNYVPKLDHSPNARPYVCKLPENIPNGAEKHWLDDAAYYTDHAKELLKSSGIKGTLVSAKSDCSDIPNANPKEVIRVANIGNQVFIRTAQLLELYQAHHKKVAFHCSSGTDRVGRISAILDAHQLKVTQADIQKYRGPLSSPKVDKIVLHYLLSQRSGADNQYRYMFPQKDHPENSWLWWSLSPIDNTIKIPRIDQLISEEKKNK